jgi:hypothetical protein
MEFSGRARMCSNLRSYKGSQIDLIGRKSIWRRKWDSNSRLARWILPKTSLKERERSDHRLTRIRFHPEILDAGGHLHISRAQSGRWRRWYNISPAFGTSKTPSSSRLANSLGSIDDGSR